MLNDLYISQYDSPLGALLLGELDGRLCYCDWVSGKRKILFDKMTIDLNARVVERRTVLHEEAITQLEHYFNGARKTFDLPLLLSGTPFQKEVWTLLGTIPYGKTWSYEELATKLKNVKAIRAIASTNGLNKLAILLPCHRVIGKDGSLTGYSGGISSKEKLLKLEGALFNGQYSLFK
jgi:methylated-DNA-[protein]-cysteine S-methyltransferase